MNESVFRREVIASLRYHFPGIYIEAKSGYIMGAGTADISCSLGGNYVAFENKLVKSIPKSPMTKLMRNGFTEIQIQTANKIIESGGLAFGLVNIRPYKTICVVRINELSNTLSLANMEKLSSSILGRVNGFWEVNKIMILSMFVKSPK